VAASAKISLVTGGSGYFGSLLVQRLVDAGHQVRVLDLNDSDQRPAGVELLIGDIRDRRLVARAGSGVDMVFNNVAQVPLARDEQLLRSVNVDGTDLLLQESMRAGVGKVHTSPSAVFGVPAAIRTSTTVRHPSRPMATPSPPSGRASRPAHEVSM
jgi:nucleoside-diphosphate-sugar epimerase